MVITIILLQADLRLELIFVNIETIEVTKTFKHNLKSVNLTHFWKGGATCFEG